MIALALMLQCAQAQLGRVAMLGEQGRHLTHLAQLRQGVVIETLTLILHLLPVLEARAVVLVEGVRVLLGQPVHFRCTGQPGMEVGGVAVLIEGRPQLVADVVLAIVSHVLVLGRANAVTLQILEQRAAVLLVIDLPRILPGHHLVGQHVVHHHADQAQ